MWGGKVWQIIYGLNIDNVIIQRMRGLRFHLTLIIICYFIICSLDGADARGKKKKKRPAGGGSGPTCASLGLDCADTCCTGEECAETKLDCAKII